MENSIFFLAMFFSFLFLINGDINVDTKESRVYIVYLGDVPYNHNLLLAQSHLDILAHVVGSKEEAKKLMVYHYEHVFSGFAAVLTKDQAKKMAAAPGVLKVMPDRRHLLHKIQSSNSEILSSQIPYNLLYTANMGDGIIVGVVDSGIYSANSKAFSDEGLGPIPLDWKGECKSAGEFDASKHCNKKVIGARWYIKGHLRDQGLTDREIQTILAQVNPSPLDDNMGHGTHVASTVAGSFVSNISYFGINLGTFRGGAPRARLAIYKLYMDGETGFSGSDVISAIDDAVHDGVHIIQMSLGASVPGINPEVEEGDGIALAAYHAAAQGVPVVLGAGNDGPDAYSVTNVAPWAITVAATTFDREYLTPITLGNNKTLMGRGLMSKKSVGPAELEYMTTLRGPNKTLHSMPDPQQSFKGKVGFLFFGDSENSLISKLRNLPKEMAELGGLALIISKPLNEMDPYGIYSDLFHLKAVISFPTVEVSHADGNQILEYLWNCYKLGTKATVSIGQTIVHIGNPLLPKVADYSSRGPNVLSPEILKPDIAAPGTRILAAVPPYFINGANANGYGFMSGTSMATPHISAIVALLKASHPDWSPAAIKSALVTTAFNDDSRLFPIYAQGSSVKLADPFDYGGGLVNPDSAAKPGLIYDMNKDDYFNYLCTKNYFILSVYNATRGKHSTYNKTEGATICQNRTISLLDLNFPSITIPNLQNSVTVTRTVTNVGPSRSFYEATVKAPLGTSVSVKPAKLYFDSGVRKITFQVTVTAKKEMTTEYTFGSLTWSDGTHSVRSPISVKKSIFSDY